jgi:chromosome segregation ATPase
LTTDVEELTEQISQLTGQEAVFRVERMSLNLDLSYRQYVYDKEDDAIDLLIDDETALSAEITTLNQQISDAISPSQISSLENLRDEKQIRLASLSAEITRRSTANNDYYRNSIAPLTAEVASLSDEITSVVHQIGEKTAEKEGKLTLKDSKNQELQSLEAGLAEKKAELNRLKELV